MLNQIRQRTHSEAFFRFFGVGLTGGAVGAIFSFSFMSFGAVKTLAVTRSNFFSSEYGKGGGSVNVGAVVVGCVAGASVKPFSASL